MSNANLPPPALPTPASLALTGIAPGGIRAKGSQILTNVVAANSVLPLQVSGSQYYMVVATGSIQVRPSSAGSVGWFDFTPQGTGKQLGDVNAFEKIEIKNDNAFAVVFQIFVGWDEIIDKRLIIAASATPQVLYPTYKTANSATSVAIPDISGQQFLDINGGKWYALYRVAMLIFNPDTGVTFLVQRSGTTTSSDFAVGVVYPQTSLRLDASGDYKINVGGGNVNAIVSEIYAALPNPN